MWFNQNHIRDFPIDLSKPQTVRVNSSSCRVKPIMVEAVVLLIVLRHNYTCITSHAYRCIPMQINVDQLETLMLVTEKYGQECLQQIYIQHVFMIHFTR